MHLRLGEDCHDFLRETEAVFNSEGLFLHPHECFEGVGLLILLLLVGSVAFAHDRE